MPNGSDSRKCREIIKIDARVEVVNFDAMQLRTSLTFSISLYVDVSIDEYYFYVPSLRRSTTGCRLVCSWSKYQFI